MDKFKALESYTDEELLAEISRRRTEAQERANRLAVVGQKATSYPKKSAAKAAYWEKWRAEREAERVKRGVRAKSFFK
ncbi:MAG TPA: hypothetical protein VFY05_09330 [Candidatus Angelobacter sp.]|nr:hypothetical protein [Candidatus Angelobacter sp.]